MAVTVWGVVKAEDGKHAVDSDSRGIVWDEDHGLLLVLVRVVGVSLAKDDEDLAAWVTDSGGPPFLYLL
jgi:hypothetical protein